MCWFEKRRFDIDYCRIEEQVTNIFTKALKTEKMLDISRSEEFGLREAIHEVKPNLLYLILLIK